jgi:hypothetical protein
MNKIMNPVFKLSIFLFAVACVAGLAGSASAQQCGITIAKEAAGSSGKVFLFDVSVDGSPAFVFGVQSGSAGGGPFSSTVSVTEQATPGWELVDIECESDGAMIFEITEAGFTATCIGVGNGTCTFFNVQEVANIPTLSEWGMIAAAAGLMLVGVWFAVRKRRAVGV